MSEKQDLEVQLLDACWRGELQTTRELVERKAVDPNTVEKRQNHTVTLGGTLFVTNGWTPLHYSCL